MLALVEGNLGWVLVGLVSLAYVAAAYALARSSFAVLGALGILATTTYFTLDGFALITGLLPFGPSGFEEDGLEPWQTALAFVAAGLVIVGLGRAENRITARRRT